MSCDIGPAALNTSGLSAYFCIIGNIITLDNPLRILRIPSNVSSIPPSSPIASALAYAASIAASVIIETLFTMVSEIHLASRLVRLVFALGPLFPCLLSLSPSSPLLFIAVNIFIINEQRMSMNDFWKIPLNRSSTIDIAFSAFSRRKPSLSGNVCIIVDLSDLLSSFLNDLDELIGIFNSLQIIVANWA